MPDRPEHGVVHERLEPRIPPHPLLMAKGGVEHASTAIGAGPGQRPAIRMPVDEVAGEIDRGRVEAQQYMRAADIEIANLIDLVRERDRRTDGCDHRVGPIRNVDAHGLVPRMLIEIASNELAV